MTTTHSPAVYVRFVRTGTIHLFHHAEISAGTLCGRRIAEEDEIGDETISGLASTCATCKSGLRDENRQIENRGAWGERFEYEGDKYDPCIEDDDLELA